MRKSKPKTSPVQTGTVSGVEDHGTIIVVRLLTEAGWEIPVFFDHRPFHWLLQGEGCNAHELVGRQVRFDGQTLNFSG